MATREELIHGIEFTVRQAKRTTSFWPESEWDAVRASGWTPKQVFCHLATVAQAIPHLAQLLEDADESTDIGQAMDIDASNAQAVSAMASLAPGEIFQTFETNYGALVEFVNSMSDEQLQMKRAFLCNSIPVSDILASAIMMHGIHHVYEANSHFA